ncbi:MAG TPA: ATP-binding protein [Acidiferrobacterales bacterium]|nr:ATP-binding protein [Acidiferrobacterales bacterium]
MYLRHIVLQDWKAYVNGRFEFSAPSSRRNVILIGAKNGYGKTSLFEAIVLGLFGRDGLPLIADCTRSVQRGWRRTVADVV